MFKLPSPVYAPDGDGGGQQQQQQAQTPPGGGGGGGDSLLAGDKGGGQQQQDTPPTELPSNWRDLMAGGDQDVLTELGRFKTYGEFAKNALNLKKQVRSGSELSDPMPDIGDGKDQTKLDALKTWREKHGVPAESTGYTLGDKDALKDKFTDADKPALDSFFDFAHKKGMSQAQANGFLEWYQGYAAASEELLAGNDKKDVTAAEDALRTDWGADFSRNLATVRKAAAELFGGAEDPDKYGGGILDARLPNGTKLGSIPGFAQGILKAALAVWGDGTLVGDEAVKATESRKAELERMASTDYDKYVQSGGQAEYRKILEAEDRAASNRRH